MCDFENKIKIFFKQQNIFSFSEKDTDKINIGVAVSGGADSVSLLLGLCNILTPLKIPVHVITVNHFIRPDEETCGDVLFVQNFCNTLKEKKFLLSCSVYNLEKGKVSEVAAERKCGIEEAARVLRYEAFESFIQENKLDFLCLAHNKNDDLETILMRFINGSSCEGLRGIEIRRNKFLRPLSNITRCEIEEYLIKKNVSWRTDSTNFDTNYLRNKIRLKMIPFLNENFPNWEKGVLKTAENLQDDFKIINSVENVFLEKNWNKKDNSVSALEFKKQEYGLQKKIILTLCNQVSKKNRISSSFIEHFCLEIKVAKKQPVVKQFLDMEFVYDDNKVLIRKARKMQTELNFFAIIEEEGNYDFPFGHLEVVKADCNYVFIFEGLKETKIELSQLPVCVRNAQLDDEILCKEGNYKKVSDIYSNWHVQIEDRNIIPVIQDLTTCRQEIICIAGSVQNYADWIVQNR